MGQCLLRSLYKSSRIQHRSLGRPVRYGTPSRKTGANSLLTSSTSPSKARCDPNIASRPNFRHSIRHHQEPPRAQVLAWILSVARSRSRLHKPDHAIAPHLPLPMVPTSLRSLLRSSSRDHLKSAPCLLQSLTIPHQKRLMHRRDRYTRPWAMLMTSGQ